MANAPGSTIQLLPFGLSYYELDDAGLCFMLRRFSRSNRSHANGSCYD